MTNPDQFAELRTRVNNGQAALERDSNNRLLRDDLEVARAILSALDEKVKVCNGCMLGSGVVYDTQQQITSDTAALRLTARGSKTK